MCIPGSGISMKTETEYWISRYKNNHACSYAVQKCSTEIQTEDSSSSEHLWACFFLPASMPCYSEGKWLDVGRFPDIMPWNRAVFLWLGSCCGSSTWVIAAVYILGARSRVMTTAWVNACIVAGEVLQRGQWEMTEVLHENELVMLLNGTEVLFSELQCWFGIWNIGLILLRRHKIHLFSPRMMGDVSISGVPRTWSGMSPSMDFAVLYSATTIKQNFPPNQ